MKIFIYLILAFVVLIMIVSSFSGFIGHPNVIFLFSLSVIELIVSEYNIFLPIYTSITLFIVSFLLLALFPLLHNYWNKQ